MPAPTPPAPSIRIMLVDDHQTVLWGLEKLINGESPKMEVVGKAANCADALRLAKKIRPDIILLDLDLGGESGLDIIPALLKDGRAHVVILTGVRDLEVADRAVLNGARGIVRKEEPAEILLRAIEKIHGGELWLDRGATGRIFVALSRAGGKAPPDPDAARIATLTPKERRITTAIVKQAGAGNREIAKILHMSEHTLRNHLTSIYAKLEVKNRMDLFIYATRHGLDRPSR